MERRITAEEAWRNAQYIVGRTAVLDYILDIVKGISQTGIMELNWRMDSRETPPIPIIELFRNKEVSDFVVEVLVNLGYTVDFEEGMYGKISIKWGPDKPSKPL